MRMSLAAQLNYHPFKVIPTEMCRGWSGLVHVKGLGSPGTQRSALGADVPLIRMEGDVTQLVFRMLDRFCQIISLCGGPYVRALPHHTKLLSACWSRVGAAQ